MEQSKQQKHEARMAALESARAKKAADRAAGTAAKKRTISERHAAKPTNLRLAIAAFCVGCMGGEDAPGVREQVRGCSSPKCPLFRHRPYRHPHAKEAT